MSELSHKLGCVASAPSLMVACDYDGTISPIARTPNKAIPSPNAIDALRKLSTLDNTYSSIISGRSLVDLEKVSGNTQGIILVGGHGTEFQNENITVDSRSLKALQELAENLRVLSTKYPGSIIETKPTGIAAHYRRLPKNMAMSFQKLALQQMRPWKDEVDATIRTGKKVVELSINQGNKGSAIQRLRKQYGIHRMVFIGDDLTDEDAFAVLQPTDIGIKVGPEESLAPHHVPSQKHVSEVLFLLLHLRKAF